ncbi:indolepyruvate oxidoreductase subunit beta family protein [Kineobactrum salinum]|uniref:Indolepyruvate oxidoreductase subunit beta family protein n=1 Tax=Kineobactrum salinum TaxID=2708301 RepID=A0A6C0TXF9_9GAMM|nr:indolepyruvate oxidoreductase subunit beta family protein [Kineobactrum salinum]QIB64520.1 indolepyruvate oxidoreductase subunit beta family protein [Kineobactrum salinum]
MTAATQTINMVIAALGGEGGGVLTNWIIDVADREGWLCQSTSLAGVAQRTGATIYYLEMFPRSELPEGVQPVMSLFPAQGDIDVAIASEVAEAGRMVQRGFITPQRTTLIASDHRVYGITEKEHLSDGIVDALALQEVAGRYARDYIHYDMLTLANEHGTVISSVLLGALAGAGVLPFDKSSYEAVISSTGKAVASNMAAFEASYQRASNRGGEQGAERGVEQFVPAQASPAADAPFKLPAAASAEGERLLGRLQAFPVSCHEVVYHALAKLVDYQDYAYADQYLDEIEQLLALDRGDNDYELTCESARYLALWMCFEDIPRVAQFKTRASRMDKVRSEVRAEDDQLFHVTEFFRPRVEEMAAILPARLGRWVLGSSTCCRFLNLFTGGKQLRTNTLAVYLTLRTLAGLRRWRRASLGYQHEHALIGRWLQALKAAAARPGDSGQALALELAECGRLVKGYGDTRARTSGQMQAMLERIEQQPEQVDADAVAQWRSAALADDENRAFAELMAQTPPSSSAEQAA